MQSDPSFFWQIELRIWQNERERLQLNEIKIRKKETIYLKLE